ncbi:U3 small nucleolar RNA-associated protein 7, putative [Plasmodium berghei]|uniref:U3 small nucleolar RNA-associated protein 7, putative n=2 Tax=Plasmodium berghei TaxID=5821 RepID=A0A509AI30_PLABA|nr:U3 small nucleolar RNA-associated protein 7, putative [Plasmodium berghei ANKA]CXI20157.1 U3 small nucleolar RNA-associated protein 7, putative [Plasmodium berghei]SCM19925.1 U3 small nucleolar RNA-associated protein 7, putative [Plasmodium berghei]SCN23633.1 U3 small nucleolar RNA-associated protein 7, putative [Plasmodium berghei]SCO59187.1 U3 small nucleolar RNA-associated protein 7, putative [Plasmodium berghei]SCO59999.1 U3 small nucleolar RNA-associated protein 7, putative [Plasmodium|eukprot:XP_034420701.1 U3 small nucleolar RNA-associated protein 7, putative [Plasmodium berghei ANKA]
MKGNLFVEQNVETEKISENKLNINTDKIIHKIKKKIRKKQENGHNPNINLLPNNKEILLSKDFPNPKNIKNKKIKKKLSTDVKLAILSSKKIISNAQFNNINDQGYIKLTSQKNEKNIEKKNISHIQNISKDATNEGLINLSKQKGELKIVESKTLKNENFFRNDSIKITQKYIYENADVGTQKKVFDLHLNMGPYTCNYSRNGKYLLITGEKGHISFLDTHNMETLCELQVNETVKCNTIFHNHKLFAIGQKKYIYIYDNTGIEVNCIKDILYPCQLEFLPYHFLLASIGDLGELVYQDVSVGNIITRKKTKRGPCSIMKQNKQNAIIYLGHKNGHVTLWSPNMDKSLCDIFSHKTAISSIGVFDNYLITAGIDCTYKLWDIRKLEYINSFKSHNIINNIDISDTSMVAFSMNSHFRTYKNFFTKPELYLTHNTWGDRINSITFQPFEDICCAGLKYSIKSFIVPGSGLANIDTFVNNPYETKKQTKENEIRQLLDKLPPETIQFRQNEIGKVNPHLSHDNIKKNILSEQVTTINTVRSKNKNISLNRHEKHKNPKKSKVQFSKHIPTYPNNKKNEKKKKNKNKNKNKKNQIVNKKSEHRTP